MNLRGGKKIDPAVLAQIENGVSAKQYLQEGGLIMHDVFQRIEQLKQGNYNNYIDENAHAISNRPGNRGEIQTKRTAEENLQENVPTIDAQSLISRSVVSQTVKGKRALQIRRLEREYQKLNKRYEQVTDPLYITDIK